MVKEGLNNYFEEFLKKEPFFKDKKVLQSNYSPEIILHRENEVNKVAGILAPALRGEKPSNMFLYGKTGTGKTLTAKHVTASMTEIAEKNSLPLKIYYLNCKLKRVADTEYRLVAELARFLGEKIPATGLPTDEVYKVFLNTLESKHILMVLILDEIDQLVSKAGDQILYNLTRINAELKNSQISVIGISNDLMFTNYLDPRVVSSLSEEELIFPPYNAIQIQSILKERAKLAFKEGAVGSGVIEKCAGYAAREHGDARRALELLRVAAELAERKNLTQINLSCLDEAEEKIERDRVNDIVTTQPKQSQVALLAIFDIAQAAGNKPVFTGDIYDLYKQTCQQVKIRPLTQRRISDIIAELDMLGIINAKVISKGRYGRTRQIGLGIPQSQVPKLQNSLKETLGL
jgi:archaeal cell division control protein 6